MTHTQPIACAIAPPTPDLFGFEADTLHNEVIRYASGVASPAIWEGYTRAMHPVCVAVADMGRPALQRAARYAEAGGLLLVDSGAFIYRDRPNDIPWASIYQKYETLAKAASAPITFVLPDGVGSQPYTYEVLSEWGNAFLEMIHRHGHRALLVVQGGDQAPDEFVTRCLAKLRHPVDGLGIPSKAAAMPARDLARLANLPASVPQRVHFLGLSANGRKLQERLLILKDTWPEAIVSCDACLHRAAVGEGKPITAHRRQVLTDSWDDTLADWDDTEDDDLHDQALDNLRAQMPHLDDDDLQALMCSGWGATAIMKRKARQHEADAGPKATTESIYRFAVRTA
ncbi:MAG: Uncharacterized protein AWU57_609 [Marinobacter sp. T13-3]|nr:MAG: Uncharacterized protein AWU57_609 [Marinobacter sp. T13-3]